MAMPVRSSVHVYGRTRIYPIRYPDLSGDDPVATYNCTFAEYVGAFVRLKDDDGTAVQTATATEIETVLGVITQKPSNTTAVVQVLGTVTGVFRGLTPGTVYFLGLGGKAVAPPLLPDGSPYVQRVGMAVAPDALYLTLTGPIVRRAGA